MFDTHYAVNRLWAKKARTGNQSWLPLLNHLEDSAALARIIWQIWLPQGTAQTIASGCSCTVDEAGQLFVFIMAAHDGGKALPVFQAKPSGPVESDLDERLIEELKKAGLPVVSFREFDDPQSSKHALAGQIILEAAGCRRNIAAIIGSHHGKPASSHELLYGSEDQHQRNFNIDKAGRPAWDAVRAELVRFALCTAGYKSFDDMPVPDTAAQVLLSGLAVIADWIASNESYFPYIGIDDNIQTGMGKARALAALKKLDFIKTVWQPFCINFSNETFVERFGFPPRPLQSDVIKAAAAIEQPGIFIIEATTGIGKTETALSVAEIFASTSGRAGIFFALPTQATSDGMFPRLLKWIASFGDGSHSVSLVHAKAQFNDDLNQLSHIGASGLYPCDSDGAAVYAWFEGRKKALLADFAVGTVDQLLQLALKQKHVMLRHVALANKIVIIDECHAYDAYMNVYLKRALRWLGSYNVPVIMLSATLPEGKRDELTRAYLGDDKPKKRSAAAPDHNDSCTAYPIVTYTNGAKVYSMPVNAGMPTTSVDIRLLDDSEIVALLDSLLVFGGCVGIIVNTVSRAQALADELLKHFGADTVRLLHSRFIASDRINKERELRAELGAPAPDVLRPHKRIVVGTQVIEQSLDLDFDVMLTDLCPVDLLLQRIGRLHRHSRLRPAGLETAMCYILGANTSDFESGAAAIYGEYLLMRTKALLPKQIILPDDVSPLVQNVYSDRSDVLPSLPRNYEKARQDWQAVMAEKEHSAKAFRISPPQHDKDDNITGWLDAPVGDAAGEAAVRDAGDSLEVIAIQRDSSGELCPISSGKAVPRSLPSNSDAQLIARETLRLPPALCRPYNIAATIKELEAIGNAQAPLWQNSPWLKGCLLLVLNSDYETRLLDYRLKYDGFYGLTCKKEVDMND